MHEPDREVRHERYRNSMCVDCGVEPYSAGRPRCTACHRDMNAEIFTPGLVRRSRL